ncbi:MAG TPA: excisionase family DNA-binding protein [Mesorhizobium sp.]|nr:excisionase family DNA-binding protein [Mesorhizobium sp.]
MPPKLLSVHQTCDTLGIGRTHFYKLVAEGRLTIVKMGSRTLVRAEVLDAFLASLPDSGRAPRRMA